MGSVGFLLYLLLVSCVFMLVSIDWMPMEACLQMSRLLLSKWQESELLPSLWQTYVSWNNARALSKCQRALDQQAFYRIPRIVQEQTLWMPKGFIKVQLLRKKVSAVTAEDIVKFLISKDAAGNQKLHVRSCNQCHHNNKQVKKT